MATVRFDADEHADEDADEAAAGGADEDAPDLLATGAERVRRRFRVPHVPAWTVGVTALTAALVAVLAPMLTLYRSITWMGSGASARAMTDFAFDGWGHPLTAHSIDGLGFPFAGRGPSFGLVTVGCAVVLVVGTVVRAQFRSSGVGGQLVLVAGVALLTTAATMRLTVQPGQSWGAAGAHTVVTAGLCLWCTAAAGAIAVLAGVVAVGSRGPSAPSARVGARTGSGTGRGRVRIMRYERAHPRRGRRLRT